MGLVVLWLGAMKRSLGSALAIVDHDPVALLGKFDAFLIGKLTKAPERSCGACRRAVIEPIRAAFFGNVGEVKISIPAERLNHLIDELLGLDRARIGRGSRLNICFRLWSSWATSILRS